MKPTIHWPIIIKLSGVDELVFIPDLTALQADTHLMNMRFQQDDRMYDATGQEFLIDTKQPDTPIPTGTYISLDEAVQLVRRHAAQDGACCIAKLNARSIADVFELLA